MLLIAITLLFATTVLAEYQLVFDKNAVHTTLFEQLFKDDDNFNKVMESSFKALDYDDDGYVEVNKLPIDAYSKESQLAKDQFLSMIQTTADEKNDGFISQPELASIIKQETQSQPLIVDKKMCKRVSKILKPCSKNQFLTLMNATVSESSNNTRNFLKACNNGFNTLNDYSGEKCILAISEEAGYKKASDTSCYKVKQCLSDYFGFSEEQRREQNMDLIVRNRIMSLFGLTVLFPLSMIPVLSAGGTMAAMLTRVATEGGFSVMMDTPWRNHMKQQNISMSDMGQYIWENGGMSQNMTLMQRMFGSDFKLHMKLMFLYAQNNNTDFPVGQFPVDKYSQGSVIVKNRLSEMLRDADSNNDGYLSRQEVIREWVKTDKIVLVKEEKLCEDIGLTLRSCQKSPRNATDTTMDSFITRQQRKTLESSCHWMYSSLIDYRAERCVINVQQAPGYKRGSPGGCNIIKQCIEDVFN